VIHVPKRRPPSPIIEARKRLGPAPPRGSEAHHRDEDEEDRGRRGEKAAAGSVLIAHVSGRRASVSAAVIGTQAS